jgi:hypothetical protein|tara:strand:- start:49 stop:630 length:582 start_codon:yes stop_codon:yes gene_type:complete
MKKFLVTMLCLFPVGAFALTTSSDVVVISDDASIAFDQDGSQLTVGYDGLSFSTSDTVDIGIGYEADFGLFSGGLSYDYTTDEESVVGLTTSLSQFGAQLDAELSWNVNDSDISAKIGTGYAVAGIDGSVTSNWDVDDFSYEGMDVTAGYTWNVSDNFSVRPNVTLPIDSDWDRGDLMAGVSIKVTFGATSTE